MNYTNHWYQIKGWHAEDEWEADDSCYDEHKYVAEYNAERYWEYNLCDPIGETLEVWVKSQDGVIKKYNVQAEAQVNFYANEVE